MSSREEALRLKVALGWLESHRRRLEVEHQSAERRLAELASEIDRIGREIDGARSRLDELGRGPVSGELDEL